MELLQSLFLVTIIPFLLDLFLAGEMLAVAEPFLHQNMHPTVLVSAYRNALEDALAICEKVSFKVDTSVCLFRNILLICRIVNKCCILFVVASEPSLCLDLEIYCVISH